MIISKKQIYKVSYYGENTGIRQQDNISGMCIQHQRKLFTWVKIRIEKARTAFNQSRSLPCNLNRIILIRTWILR